MNAKPNQLVNKVFMIVNNLPTEKKTVKPKLK